MVPVSPADIAMPLVEELRRQDLNVREIVMRTRVDEGKVVKLLSHDWDGLTLRDLTELAEGLGIDFFGLFNAPSVEPSQGE